MSIRDDSDNALAKAVIEWGLAFAYYGLQYYSMHPAQWTLLKMRLALTGKREADRMVELCEERRDRWQSSATRFAQWYNELRP